MNGLIFTKRTSVAAALAVLALSAGAAEIDTGRREYEQSCAICHGTNGKGDGSFSEMLQLTIPDLTTLSIRNGGVFPVDRVYAVIDGREEVKAHGMREMPIWGRHFSFRSAPIYDEFPHDSEAFVRSRILALIDFLHHWQVR